ncbi:MAG: mannose-6-phosphate isomerase [Chloroflexi bacterium]|nr:mannose-6-phosphate isomerase [Chloroflexota bacterium]
MAMPEIYPMTFEPVFRDYMWGGRNLERLFGRKLPDGVVAESWEISALPGSSTRAETGYWKWRTLQEVVGDLGGHFIGSTVRERFGVRFPLLIKLLDAQADLSVQVHPNDAYASEHENGSSGKSEMWYVLHAEPGAELILGTKPGTQRTDLEAAIQGGTLPDVLQRLPIRAGDAFSIPAGTIHALLKGCVVAEIQQSSDITYRIYDWQHLDANGHARPLSIVQALDVLDFEQATSQVVSPQVLAQGEGVLQEGLVAAPHFNVERIILEPGARFSSVCDGTSFQVLGCMNGAGTLRWSGAPMEIGAVRFVLLPAIMGEYTIVSDQASTWLRTYIA